VRVDATVADAVHLMQERGVGCLVVIEAGSLRGIFTERDLVTRVLGKVDSLDVPLSEYMTPDPITARVDEPIHKLLTRMYQQRIRHIPVVDADGRPVGTMSIKRAVYFVADHYPTAVLNVAPDAQSYPETREGG
jgi:CBS domain-containing protein